VSSDLLNFRRLAEFFELVEGDCEVGTWGLVDWLVSDHIELFLKVTAGTGQAVCVLSGFVVTTALTVGVFFAKRASRSSGVSPSLVPLSMLTWKIMPPNPGGKVGQPEAVFVEPSEDSSGLSFRMLWRDSVGSVESSVS
jgi:hypothetical protein